MTLLKRDMSAITTGFKAAWGEYSKRRAESRKTPIGADVTPEQFREALAEFGIDSPAKLAEVVGLSTNPPTQAETIWRHPDKLTAERQRKLLAVVDKALCEKYNHLRDMDTLAEETGDDDYRADAAKASDDLNRAVDAATLLGSDRYFGEAERAARLEFQARALVEGFNALTDADRRLVLRFIDGMLSRYPRGDAGALRHMLGKTRFGDAVILRDLAELVAGGEEADYLWTQEPEVFEYEVLKEYAGGEG